MGLPGVRSTVSVWLLISAWTKTAEVNSSDKSAKERMVFIDWPPVVEKLRVWIRGLRNVLVVDNFGDSVVRTRISIQAADLKHMHLVYW